MHASFIPAEGTGNHKAIYNDVIRKAARRLIPEDEQGWYAEYVFHIPKESLSTYLNGSRSFPAWLVPEFDRAFKRPALLDILAKAEDGQIHEHAPFDPKKLEKLFVMALREEGVFNSMMAEGMLDHFQEPSEIEHLDRELGKISRFISEIQERVQAMMPAPVARRRA